jgi:lysophospholipase L1-like esterase
MIMLFKYFAYILMFFLSLSSTVFAETGEEMRLIVGWGDSLTEGFCNHGYNEVLLSQMTDGGRPTIQVNCGFGGEISTKSLNRLQDTLMCEGISYERGYCTDKEQKYIWSACDGNLWSRKGWYTFLNGKRPDFILIWVGANDEIHKIGLTTTIYNIKEMIRISREYKMTPIIATLTGDGKYGQTRCDEGSIGGFNYTLLGLALDENVVLADQCAAIPYWTDNDCGDALHPNDKGNQTIAQTWLNVLPQSSDYYGTGTLSINGPLFPLLGK